jgi:hypothetical protein
LGVESTGEVGDGDVPFQRDVVEGFPVDEDVPCRDVGQLRGLSGLDSKIVGRQFNSY